MKKSTLLAVCFTAILFFGFLGVGRAQFSIAAGGTNYTQDFTSLGTVAGTWADNTTLTGWYARTDATATITAIGVNTGSTTTGALYSYGVAATNPLTDRALGFAPSNAYTGGSGIGKGYIGWRLVNNTGGTISSILVTWTGEQWRRENNAAFHSMNLEYLVAATVPDVISGTYTATGSQFVTPIVGATTGVALDGNAPANRDATLSATITVTIPAGSEIMLRWSDLNDSGNDHLMAIDDVTVNATISGALTPPVLTADNTNNNVDNNIEIGVSNVPGWLGVVTAVKVNNSPLTVGTDYTLTASLLTLKPSGLNSSLTTAGSKTVTIEATGYNSAFVTQQIDAGAISAAISTATISPALAINTTGTVTATAKDQYANPIAGYTFKYDAAITNANLTTAESYLIDGVARTASVTDISLTTVTAADGVTTFPIVIPAVVDGSDGVSVQLQLSNGTTNVGLPFAYYKVPSQITITGTDPGNTGFYQGYTNNIIYSLQITVTNDNTTLSQLLAPITGTYLAADIAASGFNLRYSADAILSSSTVTDPIIGTLSSAKTGASEVLTFTGLTQAFTVGTAYLFITADIALTATPGRTIAFGTTSNGNFTFVGSPTFSGSVFNAANTHAFLTAPVMTELVVPKYIAAKTAASTNNARTPFAACLQIDNLLPNTSYDIRPAVGMVSEAATVYGAGNVGFGGSFGTANMTNAFTTNASGSSGPFWIYIQPTGNATRFAAGVAHNIRIGYAVNGTTMPSTPNFVGAKVITPLDVTTAGTTTATTDDGAYIKGSADITNTGKYVLLYDNVAGTGDPLFSYQIRQAANTSLSYSELPTAINDVYMQAGTSAIGDYPAVIPIGANNPNGVRRIEARNANNTVSFANTDDDGIWPSGVNTTTLVRKAVGIITVTDAPLIAGSTKTLNLTGVLLEGLYAGGGIMNQAQGHIPPFTTGVADFITVELHDAGNYATIIGTPFINVPLSTTGTATVNVPVSNNGSYFITIKHRNSLETTTSSAVSFSGGIINQSFSAPANVYGGNLGLMIDGHYAIYGGDVSQDGNIDSGDFIDIDNDSFNYATGYLATDVTGDGNVDSGDFIAVDNNGFNYVSTSHP